MEIVKNPSGNGGNKEEETEYEQQSESIQKYKTKREEKKQIMCPEEVRLACLKFPNGLQGTPIS